MIVHVADIPPEGLKVEGVDAFPHPFQDATWTLDEVDLLLEREGEDVLVTGELAARVPQHCSRCLEPYVVRVTPQVSARYVPGAAREEHELGSDDLETDVYHGGQVDLTALLETETSLALPMKPLCAPDCRGLCPVCGGNRNQVTCSCQQQTDDPRWAKLRAWAGRSAR